MFRIGHGYDVHKFTDKKQNIIIGGIEILYYLGLEAHSDGDVLIHAMCDAMLGALALGDIGRYFPDTDKQFKNIDSRFFLARIGKLLYSEGYEISNIDITRHGLSFVAMATLFWELLPQPRRLQQIQH